MNQEPSSCYLEILIKNMYKQLANDISMKRNNLDKLPDEIDRLIKINQCGLKIDHIAKINQDFAAFLAGKLTISPKELKLINDTTAGKMILFISYDVSAFGQLLSLTDSMTTNKPDNNAILVEIKKLAQGKQIQPIVDHYLKDFFLD